MNNNLYLDIHVIQTLPPSNINRDDTGSPKTAQYGGVRRARVSSQSWKRAIREYFKENSEAKNIGIRSLDIVRYVAEQIRKIDQSIEVDESIKMANEILNKAGVKTKDNKAKALFFLGKSQAMGLAKAAIEKNTDKKELQEILKSNPAIDIALFGRMVADDPYLNEDASCQVAHAISTHAVQTEFDFFTASDDLQAQNNAGAGMLGTIEFNSSTVYRYANIALHELIHQLGEKEATINTAKLFVEAFSNSLPTGKVNTFANQTIPKFILVSLRKDRPVNLVTAYEKPVYSKEGYTKESIDRLLKEYESVQKFVEEPIINLCVIGDSDTHEILFNKLDSSKELIDKLGKELENLLPEK